MPHPTSTDPSALPRLEWKLSFAHDPIDLRNLPTRQLICKARHILAQIAAGTPYTCFRGKRFRDFRTTISVPLGRRYRLLFCDEQGTLRPLCCLSHEAYNKWKPQR